MIPYRHYLKPLSGKQPTNPFHAINYFESHSKLIQNNTAYYLYVVTIYREYVVTTS